MHDRIDGPHQGNNPVLSGAPLGEAAGAVILIHGRGANAHDLLPLEGEFDIPSLAYVALQASGNSWYPLSFLAPVAQNEPYLTSALQLVGDTVGMLAENGLEREKIALLGFSQGACLSLEFAARHPERIGAVIAFSGGLIGAPGSLFEPDGTLENVPVFLGCSDVDPHIPEERVRESAALFQQMGAAVTLRLYPGMGHTLNRDEIDRAREILDRLVSDI